MFKSVLVANRGEIACRIFRTAKAMGLRTIAVFSDADAKAKHVRQADAAFHIGPAPANESYLRGDVILAVAKKAGAEAIHPGYGFLSENPEFAEAVVQAGLAWIGPTPSAIRAMGLKDESKRIAIEAGVPVLAGYQGEDQSEKRLLKAAKDIGFPILIKAVAGGGGRGIREVKNAEEFKAQLESAQREAKAAFGNDVVLIEKLVERPRHIEVQVFGDKHGNVVHLFERDCSLQRRRQKVIEEAPAPGMTQNVRAAMTDAAVKLARAVKYENAGTVEFIVDGNGPLREDGFWFLEMNTRLQVEHPVTEAITGLDLVEWQLRVAAGEKLPLTQSQIAINGHAIEARICAEDPSEGFRPSVGKIRVFELDASQRVDAGFDAHDHVPSAYDSLLAKQITWAPTREQAIYHGRVALGRAHVEGVTTNAGFLLRCLESHAFQVETLHTGLIADEMDALSDRGPTRAHAALALAVMCKAAALEDAGDVWADLDGWRLNRDAAPEWRFEDQSGAMLVRDVSLSEAFRARVNDEPVDAYVSWVDGDEIEADFDLRPVRAKRLKRGGDVVLIAGEAFTFHPLGATADLHAGEGGDDVKAPLPGKIVAVAAKEGAAVKKGDVLATLEAMKMEHGLKAPRDGIIAEVNAEEGAQVKEGAVLVRLEGA
jgi:acetyl/propionyl-CoA carboxylase alpha subunit